MNELTLDKFVEWCKEQLALDASYAELLKAKTEAYALSEALWDELTDVAREAGKPLIQAMAEREKELVLQLAITRRMVKKWLNR